MTPIVQLALNVAAALFLLAVGLPAVCFVVGLICDFIKDLVNIIKPKKI